MKGLIAKTKEKKELSDVPDSLVEEVLNKTLKKHNLSQIPEKEKYQKQIIKEARAELRKYTGMFQINKTKRLKLLGEGEIQELLKTHTSTRERLAIYPELIGIIKSLNPKTILDLGAGLNPLAIAPELKNVEYIAYDIKRDEIDLINQFFKKNNIQGMAEVRDIRKIEKFPKADLVLIFKTLDIIETKGHRFAHQIISSLKPRNIIVSFSTKTLSGKSMEKSRRLWFESLLKSFNLQYEVRLFNNEIFYLIRRL